MVGRKVRNEGGTGWKKYTMKVKKKSHTKVLESEIVHKREGGALSYDW